MKNILGDLITQVKALETSERRYWLGMIMLLIGLSWSVSLGVALAVVGVGIALESVVTSYLAQLIKAWVETRSKHATH